MVNEGKGLDTVLSPDPVLQCYTQHRRIGGGYLQGKNIIFTCNNEYIKYYVFMNSLGSLEVFRINFDPALSILIERSLRHQCTVSLLDEK